MRTFINVVFVCSWIASLKPALVRGPLTVRHGPLRGSTLTVIIVLIYHQTLTTK